MTNKEYLIQTLSGLNISDGDIDVIILKAGIDGSLTADFAACDMAVYKRMSVILKGALQNTTEGGYAVSWNMEAVKLFYLALCEELGMENVLINTPKVRNKSFMW